MQYDDDAMTCWTVTQNQTADKTSVKVLARYSAAGDDVVDGDRASEAAAVDRLTADQHHATHLTTTAGRTTAAPERHTQIF